MCVAAQNQISRVLHKGHLRKSNDGEKAVCIDPLLEDDKDKKVRAQLGQREHRTSGPL